MILTGDSIKTFGIELNQYLKIVDIGSYDKSISQLAILKKYENETFAICLGNENIIVYDIKLGKIERIQYEKSEDDHSDTMYQFAGNQYLGIKINKNFYLARDRDF